MVRQRDAPVLGSVGADRAADIRIGVPLEEKRGPAPAVREPGS